MQLIRLVHTIRYLQFRQLFYRVWYKVKKTFYSTATIKTEDIEGAKSFPSIPFFDLHFSGSFSAPTNKFTFLNKEKEFGQDIDWNYQGYGKLWLYNLGYFEYLRDDSIMVEQRKKLILSFISFKDKEGFLEPYPISLRGIEWIKFFSRYGISITEADVQSYRGYRLLAKFPEYHISGNHLLENGFSLLFGAHYLNNKRFYAVARKILDNELKAQILGDGAHFEKSPAYHTRLLGQLLSCIELVRNSGRLQDDTFEKTLVNYAMTMLGWMKSFAFSDGSLAMFGDAAPENLIPVEALYEYAAKLNIKFATTILNDSGYRKLEGQDWELIVNAGLITAPHQPGHIHADAGTFCVQWKGKPLIVDTGISTYENNERRRDERGTAAHNTVVINNENSSEIWASFRMGRRVKPVIITQHNKLTISYSPYLHKSILHERKLAAEENKIIITDSFVGLKENKAFIHLHFHPSVQVAEEGDFTYRADGVQLRLKGIKDVCLEEYMFARGFNDLVPAKRIRVAVAGFAETEIDFTC